MKTKIQIENNWIDFSDRLSEKYQLNKKQSLQLRDEIAKEFMWFFSNGIKQENVENRIKKYERLFGDGKIEALKFDPWWSHRLEFLRWILD